MHNFDVFFFASLQMVLKKNSGFAVSLSRHDTHVTSLYGICRKVSNIRRTLVGNKNVDHSDVVGASPVGAARTTSSFST